MALLLLAPDLKMDKWEAALLEEDPNLDIRIWPAVGKAENITFAVCWNQPKNELKKYPNLKGIISLGAGADHLIGDPSIPEDLKICRIVSPSLTRQMTTYVTGAVLNYQRKFYQYYRQQQKKVWQRHSHTLAENLTIGVMGLGKLGTPVAQQLAALGFRVKGWSKSPKNFENIEAHAGQGTLNEFLSGTQVLICLLPLTPRTEGILNLDLFKKLEHPAYIINTARGEHLVEEDLIYALDRGWIEGATLDVFSNEPLPEHHPFWNREKIIITPHIASITYPEEVAPQVIENYKRVLSGMPLLNEIDREKGY